MKGRNEQIQVLGSSQSSNQEDLSAGFLNVQDVARYLKLRVSTVYSMAEQRRIPHYRVGRQLRFRKSEIDQWAERLKQPVVDAEPEAKKVLRSIDKKSDLDLDRIVKKVVEQSKKRGYNFLQEKPGRNKGLGKEVEDGII